MDNCDGSLSPTEMNLHENPHGNGQSGALFEPHAPSLGTPGSSRTVDVKLFTDAAILARSGRETWSEAIYRQLDEGAVRRVN